MHKHRVKPTRTAWTEFLATLTNRHFWMLMGWSAVVLGVGGALLWVAVKQWDAAMNLGWQVCASGGNTDLHILLLALVAPFFGISMLGAISELWHNLERRHHHVKPRWRPFFVFTGMVLALSVVILLALDC